MADEATALPQSGRHEHSSEWFELPHSIDRYNTNAYLLPSLCGFAGREFLHSNSVYKTPALRKPINYFIVNMAVSDFLFSAIMIPFDVASLHTNFWLAGGPFAQVSCKLIGFLSVVSSAVSFQSLILIAVDRFGAVVFPLRSLLISSKRCPYFNLATWIVAVAFFSPFLFALKLIEYEDQWECDLQWNETFGESSSYKIFFLAITVVVCFMPIALLITLYSIIYIKLKTQAFPGEQSVNAEEIRARRNRKVLKLAIAIVLGFVLYWVPQYTMALLLYFHEWDDIPCHVHLCFEITRFLIFLSCVINPIICLTLSENFRQGFKGLLKCSCAAQE